MKGGNGQCDISTAAPVGGAVVEGMLTEGHLDELHDL